MNIVKKLFRRLLKSQKGFTLIETSAVIAITATIAAVVTPIAFDKIGDAKVQAAKEDCSQIKNAITSFYSGTGNYPSLGNTNDFGYYQVLRTGGVDQYASLWSATKDPALDIDTIDDSANGWESGSLLVDLMRNHLVYDNPGSNNNPGDGTTVATKVYATAKVTWKGPYIATTDKQDPWGHNYLAFIKGASTAATPKIFGWILSAGPNGKIETPAIAVSVVGDDVGVVIGSKEAGTY